MRTTLDLDEKLIAKAMKTTGLNSKTSLIHFALSQLLRRNDINALIGYAGKIPLEYDVNSSKGR